MEWKFRNGSVIKFGPSNDDYKSIEFDWIGIEMNREYKIFHFSDYTKLEDFCNTNEWIPCITLYGANQSDFVSVLFYRNML
jgi:hypothetical protein